MAETNGNDKKRSIDERLDALTMSLELLSFTVHAHDQRLDNITDRMVEIKDRMVEIKDRMAEMKDRMAEMADRLHETGQRVDSLVAVSASLLKLGKNHQERIRKLESESRPS